MGASGKNSNRELSHTQIEILRVNKAYMQEMTHKSSSYFENVSYENIQGNHVYKLTDPSTATMLTAFTGAYSEANMIVLFETVPEFFAIGDAVAGRVKNGEYSLVDKDNKPVTDNKLWNNIKENKNFPNWQFNLQELIWHAVIYKMITGNRYCYTYAPSTVKLSHNSVMALWMLPSHYVRVKMLDKRPSFLTTTRKEQYIECYEYKGGGTTDTLLPEYVTHQLEMKLGNATDILSGKGTSRFKCCAQVLANITATYVARGKIMIQGGPRGAIISAVTDNMGSRMPLSPKEKETLTTDLYKKYGVGKNQNPNIITDIPIDYKKFGDGIRDLMPFDEIIADTIILGAVAGVPTALVPKKMEGKQTNNDTAERDFYINRIIPEALDICQMLTQAGRFNELGYKVVVEFSNIPALQDDALKSAQAFEANVTAAMELFNAGKITVNQVLDKCGFEPIPGGDVFATKPEDINTQTGNDPNKKA